MFAPKLTTFSSIIIYATIPVGSVRRFFNNIQLMTPLVRFMLVVQDQVLQSNRKYFHCISLDGFGCDKELIAKPK